MHGQGTAVALSSYGGLVSLADPSSIPEGASPRTYDTDYEVGAVRTRAGLTNVYSIVDAEIGPNLGNLAASATWTNPESLIANDGTYATMTGVGTANYVDLIEFAFNVDSTDSVTGLTLAVTGYCDSPVNISAQLLINGVPSGDIKTMALSQTDPSTLTFGGVTDLWGVLPAPAAINNLHFGVRLSAASDFALASAHLSYAAITVAVSTGTSNFQFVTTFTAQDGTVRNLSVDADGNLWVENVTNVPGIQVLADTSLATNAMVSAVNGPDVEYLAFSDGFKGIDMPLQYKPTWIDRITQVGPGKAPTFTPIASASTTYAIVDITQPSAHSQGFSYFLQSAGPGSKTPGNVITIYYLDATVAPGPDTDLVNAVNSGKPVYAYVSFTGTPQPFPATVVKITAVGEGQPPDQPRNFYYFSFTVPSVAATYYAGSGHSGYTANYQRTLATMTMAVPVPGLGIGSLANVSGNSVASWNSSWPISQTPDASTMEITGSQVTAGTATFNYAVTGGAGNPAVGELVNTTNILNAGGALNVVQYPIASVTGTTTGTFTVTGFPGTLTAGFQTEHGLASTAGTIFAFDPGLPLLGTGTNPIYGTGTGGQITFSATGTTIDTGTYQGSMFFITRNGYFTCPAPPVTFTIPENTSTLQVSDMLVGPPNVVKRGIIITEAGQLGVPGASFYTLPTSVDFYVNGAKLTATSFYVNDNTSTTATLFFNQATLLKGLSVDSYGYNLFNQIEIGDPGWIVSYDTRMFYGLCQNKIHNFLNLSFDGGYLPATVKYPAGWTTPDIYGSLIASGKFGNSYYISNTSGGLLSEAGRISQSAYQDYLQVPILSPNTKYSARVTARIPSGLTTGNLVIALVSAGVEVGTMTVPFSSLTSTHSQTIGPLLTTQFKTIPADLTLDVYASGIGAGADVEIDRISIFDTAIPVLTTTAYGSYPGLPEQVDQISGKVGWDSENQQPLNGAVVMYDTLYGLKGSLGGASLYSLQASPNLEPADWNEPEVAQKAGAIGPYAFDFGEQWIVMANRNGLYMFEGGQPGKITQEIYQVWDAINWKHGHTIWVRNDVIHRRLMIGVPMATPNFFLPNAPVNSNPTSPNVIVICNYQGLDTGGALKGEPQMHTTMFGTLNSIDMRRKWSIWQIPSPFAGVVETTNNQEVYICNGRGNSKIYRLDETAETDDGVIIDSLYTTAGLVELTKRAQLPTFGTARVRFNYMVAQLQSLGKIDVTLYPNVLLAPPYPDVYLSWQIPGGFTPGMPALQDSECSLNFAGYRAFVEFRENDGYGFSLSNLVLRGKADVWNSIRGAK